MKIVIHTDGGARGNPGPGAAAWVVEGAGIFRETRGKYLGRCTNNEAEYQAVIGAMEWVKLQNQKSKIKNQKDNLKLKVGEGVTGVLINSDSLLLVSQLSGKWKIKEKRLQELAREVKKLEREIGVKITYQYIPREQNREADWEVNRILDIEQRR